MQTKYRRNHLHINYLAQAAQRTAEARKEKARLLEEERRRREECSALEAEVVLSHTHTLR